MISNLDKIQFTRVFRWAEDLLALLVILSIFIYPAYFGPTRLENYALPLFIMVLGLKSLNFDRNLVNLLMINMVIGLVSVLLNLNLSHGLLELMRWVKYAVVLVFFSSLSYHQVSKIPGYIRLAFIIMTLVNVIQIVNPFDFGVELAKFYSHHPLYPEGSIEMDKSFRLLGTAINPNNNALLWLLMSIYFMVEFYNEKKTQSLLFVFGCFLFIIFTQSRTAIVAFLLIGLLNLFLYRLKIRHLLYIAGMGLFGAFIAIYFQFTYLWHIFLFNPLKIHSLRLRFKIWDDMLKLYYQKPFFGWGNLKNYEVLYSKPPDNEILYILLNQGSVGIFGMTLLFIYIVHYFKGRTKKVALSYLPIFMIICFVIIGMTNLSVTNVRIGMLFFVTCGMSFAYVKNENQLNE